VDSRIPPSFRGLNGDGLVFPPAGSCLFATDTWQPVLNAWLHRSPVWLFDVTPPNKGVRETFDCPGQRVGLARKE
jgi:hypothetical protein